MIIILKYQTIVIISYVNRRVTMNKLCKLMAAAALLLVSIPQNCLATDFDPITPPSSSVSGAGGNNAGDVNLAIQQSDLPEGSKHVDVSYRNDALIIRGTVQSDRDRQEIGNIAAKCGCVNIRNELKVTQSPRTKTSPKAKIIRPSH